jgi:DNA-binding transcriptional regulator YiaG
MEAAMYHYTESGLDNVWLENGYHEHETAYGRGVSIQNSEELHRLIGQDLISLNRPLIGAELRFLRLEMEISQHDLAALLGSKEQTLRLWEKNRKKAVPGSPDRLLRAYYYDFIGKNPSMRRLLKKLADIRESQHMNACFRQTKTGWAACADRALEACH